jgi:hypothetical protein
MTKQDYLQFSEMWQGVHNVMSFGKVFDNNSMMFIFELLEDYPFEVVKQAVKLYAKQNSQSPQASDIINLLKMGNKHLSPAEAWAIFPKNDFESGVITDEMLRAWCIASDLYESKQFYAAEKAFLSSYTRIVSESELVGKPIEWKLSRGSNHDMLKTTVEQAVRLGRLKPDYANGVLESLPTPATGIVAGLISGSAPENTHDFTEVAKANISQILKMFNEADEKAELERKQAREAETKRRDEMIEAALALIPPEQEIHITHKQCVQIQI